MFQTFGRQHYKLSQTILNEEVREWGQSFIGQDVCGSRYNDDPFTEQSVKPLSWEDMKKRIDSLVESKLNNTLQEKSTRSYVAENKKESGRWP